MEESSSKAVEPPMETPVEPPMETPVKVNKSEHMIPIEQSIRNNIPYCGLILMPGLD